MESNPLSWPNRIETCLPKLVFMMLSLQPPPRLYPRPRPIQYIKIVTVTMATTTNTSTSLKTLLSNTLPFLFLLPLAPPYANVAFPSLPSPPITITIIPGPPAAIDGDLSLFFLFQQDIDIPPKHTQNKYSVTMFSSNSPLQYVYIAPSACFRSTLRFMLF